MTRGPERTPPRRYVLNVKLLDTQPPVWRRLEVPGSCRLNVLHDLVQAAFEWSGKAGHVFKVQSRVYGQPGVPWEGTVQNERKFTLRDIAPQARRGGILYVYDLEDEWLVDVFVEAIDDAWEGNPAPHCLDGARSAPPETIGGAIGYAEALAVLEDPEDPAHASIRAELGDDFQADSFDRERVNRRLAELDFGAGPSDRSADQ